MQRRLLIAVLALAIAWLPAASANAAADGTYSITNTTSYTNPDTGKTDDGGSDLDIGEAMARSMTQSLMLYEVEDGVHYLTVRIGLNSYTRDMRISTQAEKNKGTGYQPVPFDVVQENKKTDTAEYRFEVESLDLRVKLTFFVNPMNRDVIFFITPDSSSVKEDKGAFAASDKASSGYSSGFAGGLTGGDAEAGKMPALVEQLTGVKQVDPAMEKTSQQEQSEKQTPAPGKNVTEATASASIATPGTGAGQALQTIGETGTPLATGQASAQPQETANLPQAAAGSTEPSPTAANTTVNGSDKAQPGASPGNAGLTGAEPSMPAANTPNPEASPATSQATAIGSEEKIPAGSTSQLADQGLTQFDSAGNKLEESAKAQQSSTGVVPFVGGAAVIIAGIIGYLLYSRSRRRSS